MSNSQIPNPDLRYEIKLVCDQHRLSQARSWVRLHPANVGADWQTMLQTVHQPTLLNHYQREYYATPDGGVRVTLDFAQVAYDQRLSARPNLRLRLPSVDTLVIEIKAAREQAERLQEIVARFPVRPGRNSKYVGSLMTA